MVSDQELARELETLLRQSHPNAFTTLDGVVQQLEAKLGLDLSHKAGFIGEQISLLLRSSQTPPKDHFTLQHQPQFPSPQHQQFPPHFALHHHSQFPSHDLDFRHQPPQPQPQLQQLASLRPQPPPQVQPQLQTAVTRPQVFSQDAATFTTTQVPKESSAPVGARRRGGPGGLNKVCCVSPALQAIVGEPALPRTEIVKQLWAYIRKNSLQDPSNKRKIICDDALRLVFETDCTDMFKMNKLLAKHITPLGPSKESSQTKQVKIDIESKSENVEPSANPVIISDALAKFLGAGEKEMLGSEAEKQVWEYIKVNHLEDPSNPMMVLCDAKLRELLGCESISVMGIRDSLLRHHFVKHS